MKWFLPLLHKIEPSSDQAGFLTAPVQRSLKAGECPPERLGRLAVQRADLIDLLSEVRGFKTEVCLRRHLAHLPARKISQLTLKAVANAVAANRRDLRQADFPRWLFDDDAVGESNTTPYYFIERTGHDLSAYMQVLDFA